MKKIAFFILIVIALISTVSYIYLNYLDTNNKAKRDNMKFEMYKDKEITGTELTTIINRVIDTNKQNNISKDTEGKYIDDGQASINIDIKFLDDDVTYNIEKIYNKGSAMFFQYYRDIVFKCMKVEYHKKTNKIKYMLFEQITQ